MKSLSAFAFLSAAAALLAGCGQTGPLYMPKTATSPPVAQPAPPPPPVISTVPSQPSGSPSQ